MPAPTMKVLQSPRPSVWGKVGGLLLLSIAAFLVLFVIWLGQPSGVEVAPVVNTTTEPSSIPNTAVIEQTVSLADWLPLIIASIIFAFLLFWDLVLREKSWIKKKLDGKKDLAEKRSFLYMALMIIVISVAYLLPGNIGSAKFLWMGAIVYLALHLVIWPFFTDSTSTLTKFIVNGFLLVIAVAVFFPNKSDETWEKIKKTRENIDSVKSTSTPDAGGANPASDAAVALVPAARTTLTPTLHVVPGGVFKKAELPPEKVLEKISWSCPTGCIAEIVHEGAMICSDEGEGTYQGISCKADVVGLTSTGVKIYNEQFKEPPGDIKIEYPTNLIHVIYSFGTIEEFGATDIPIVAIISG